MGRIAFRFVLACAALVSGTTPADAQITWNVTYVDVTQGTGRGFADPAIPSGETLTLGQLRQNTVIQATQLMNTILDGRGTIHLQIGDGTAPPPCPTGHSPRAASRASPGSPGRSTTAGRTRGGGRASRSARSGRPCGSISPTTSGTTPGKCSR